MNYIKWLLLFLFINFGALAVGNLLMANGPSTAWYQNLNKAPWTPPGWVFGVAWTTIMVCFSIYLANLFNNSPSDKLKVVFSIQVLLNIAWNYLFFNQHLVLAGLVCISLLTVVIFYMFFEFNSNPTNIKYLLLPYMVWLLIATSLNGYILINN